MADFDLTQTGQEVQNILDGAAMQTDLTAEVDRAELAEQTLQGNIDIEETRAKAAEKQNADDIDVIEGKIPAAASDENQLADKNFVNSSIATATATYRGAYNLVSDLSLTVDATHEQIATALAGEISTADNNDYCFVQIPTSSETPTQIASIERYKFNGSAWAYEYTLNNSGFTADQWAALNSGITSGLVAKLTALPTNDELTLALAGKQNVLTFDNVPIENSNNPVKSSGVYSAIGNEETRAKAAEKANADDIDAIEEKIPAAASSENQLADKSFVNSSIATATATFKGTYNLVNDLSLTIDATHEQIAAALANEISTADNNDYCFVQIPTSIETPTQIASIERYKFNGSAWAYEYTLNNSGFTADQWAALNSGITSGLVTKLLALPTNDEIVLALAGKQDVLTFDNEPTENSNNPVKSGGVYDAIDVEATTRAAAIAAIVALIPEAASALNQLADKSFVNSSISTATAVFKGTFNVVVDLELSYNATQEQIALMLASKIIAADNNDYCFVQIPTSDETPLQIARTDRYKFNGSVWAYEYTLNNSGFTSVQWAAINSGITSLLKDKLIDLPTATELTALLAAKQNELTFDTAPTAGSTNPVTSGGVKTAIDTEKARAEAAEADRYTKAETYSKNEIDGLVSTPHQEYVTVATYASLPASGSTDTIYRVSSYDGANSQVDDTVYSEYAWDGTQYVFLCVKSQIEEVFDITVYNNNTKYADLAAALGVDGANIPATLRRGGMSVKFVQSSDNNYVQARCIANEFTTDVAKWQCVDEEPRGGSRNLIESNAVYEVETSTNKKIGGIVYEETKNTSILSPHAFGNVITISLIDAGVYVGDIVDLDIQTDNTITYNLYYTKAEGRTGIAGLLTGNNTIENYIIPSDATGLQIYITEGATNNKDVTLSVLAHKGSIDKRIEDIESNVSEMSLKNPSITIIKIQNFNNETIWRKYYDGTYNPDVSGTRIFFNFPYLRYINSQINIIATTNHNFAVKLLDKNKNTLYDTGFNDNILLSPTLINSFEVSFVQIIARKKDNGATNIENLLLETLSCNFVIIDTSMTSIKDFSTTLFAYINKKAGIAKPRGIISIAHQGGRFNNIEGFKTCAENGFNAAETDIALTSDNVPVCFHDASFTDYISGDTITIANVTYEQLQTYTLDAQGNKISSFDDVLRICKLNGLIIVIDHLNFGDDSKLTLLVNIVHKYGMTGKTYYRTSFTDQVNIIKALDANANFVLSAVDLSSNIINMANLWKSDNNSVIIDFSYSYVSINDIIAAKSLNTLKSDIKLCAYTIDDVNTYAAYMPYVDCITSNTLSSYNIYI